MAGQRNGYGQRNDYGLISAPKSEFNEANKRRNPNEERESNVIGLNDTVYRYLCPLRRIGSVIGIGGEIAKQLRAETRAKIRISEVIPGCEERVVTIYSSSEETNVFGDDIVSPAQDALFKVHEIVTSEEAGLDDENSRESVVVRLLVGSDQIGCVIGKGGQVVQSIRSETGANVRILGTEHLPPCAIATDELIQISGEAYAAKKALYQVAYLLRENPSQSQHLLLTTPSIYRSGVVFAPIASAPGGGAGGGGYRGSRNGGGGNRSGSVREFSVCLVCPVESVGAVIGKGGAVIKQIRQESGAFIKVDTSDTEAQDCVISVMAKETFEDVSPTIAATMELQPRCSLKNEREINDGVITTRLLLPRARVGCLIGKGGAVINEMRNTTKATILVLSSDESLPSFASSADELVQITGELSVASNALYQVLSRLRANLFEAEGPLSGAAAVVPPALPYGQAFSDAPYGSRNAPRGRGYPNRSQNNHPRSPVLRGGDSYDHVQYGGRNRVGSDGIFSSGRSGRWD